METDVTRRDFLKKTSVLTAGAVLGSAAMASKSYSRILGANDRLNFAILGLHSRGQSLLSGIAGCTNTAVTHICDVDSREFEKFSPKVEKYFNNKPKWEKDIRILLEDQNIDAIAIATPDHWHAPMAIMGLQAGKHVYVEKPCSHNPHEGELLVKAQKKYGKLVQMGNQQRSSTHTMAVIKRIHEGLIGRPYFGKAWYSNTRPSIGTGKQVPIPDYLDWDLWQGPAPRRPFTDNIHPYKWHWYKHWGTGETLNNGTHEVDICRWALNAGYPDKITATGGRYEYQDDWEFYDTLLTSFEYADKMITWEGLSCQGKTLFKRGRGAMIHGSNGAVLIDRNGYIIFDKKDNIIEEFNKNDVDATMDLKGGGPLTTLHFKNFVNGIRNGEKLHSPVVEGNISVSMLQMANIAWKRGKTLNINTKNGHIKGDKTAKKMCRREYEKGWELKI